MGGNEPKRIFKDTTIPVEIGTMWEWIRSFGKEWLEHFPMYSDIELLNEEAMKKEESPVGLMRKVVMPLGKEEHIMTERLEFVDDNYFLLLYSLQKYKVENSDGGSSSDSSSEGPEPSKKSSKDALGAGTIFTVKLKGGLSEVDSTPETIISWLCQYEAANEAMSNLVENVLVKGIDSCLNQLDKEYEGVVGKCKILVKYARNLIAADLLTSDPYCTLRFNDMEEEEAVKTEVKKWTRNPDYDEKFELKVKSKSVQLIVAFFDYDAVGDGDDEMGTAQMEFDELEDGVEKEVTLKLDTQGQVTLTILIDMFENKPIPITPEVRKRRQEEKKAAAKSTVNSRDPANSQTGVEEEEAPSVDIDDMDVNLAQYVQAKLMEDGGFLASQTDCKLIACGFNYLKTYADEIVQNVDTGNQHKNENFLRQESCQAIKKFSETKGGK